MARYEVTCDEPRPARYPRKDARAVTLTVARDGEHLAWVRAVASNPAWPETTRIMTEARRARGPPYPGQQAPSPSLTRRRWSHHNP